MQTIFRGIFVVEREIYTVGGTVQAGGGIYLSRRADEELLVLCRNSVFAYVLATRQVGKSSLMVQTSEQLNREGIRSVIIDLSALGTQLSAEEWYLGVLTTLEDQLLLDTDVIDWWESRANLGMTQRLTLFFEEVLLWEIEAPIVIFVDEIDTTLSLDFTDDFYAAIRYLYTSRYRQPAFSRLSFVLVGVATPSDLIRDPKRTPFNIGRRVDLTDFTVEEALPLAAGWGLSPEGAKQAIAAVLAWTGGHPFLTQRLCAALVERERIPRSEAEMEPAVEQTFLGAMSDRNSNLLFVRDILTKRSPDLSAVLTTYREVLRNKQPVLDEAQSLVKSHLKLSGVVLRREDGVLRVRNPIYRRAFDESWVTKHLPVNWKKRLQHIAVGLFITFFLLPVPFAFLALNRAQEVKKQTVIAQSNLARTQFLSNQGLNSLITAVRAGKQIKDDLQLWQTASRWDVVSALQQVVYNIRERNRFQGYSGAVNGVSFSPDGQTLASASDNGTVKLWNFNLDNLLVQGCNWLRGYLTYNPDVREEDRRVCDGIWVEDGERGRRGDGETR